MKKPKTCGKCKHYSNGFCHVTDLSANEYDAILQCIFYFMPLKFARTTFEKMKKKYLKNVKSAQIDINNDNMKGENINGC